jgi:glycosyltransferase involved in cell wall biosynthesis
MTGQSQAPFCIHLYADGLLESDLRAWLDFLSVMANSRVKAARLVVEGKVHLKGLVGAYRANFGSISFEAGSAIDWTHPNAFVFSSRTLTAALFEHATHVHLLPSGPPNQVSHEFFDQRECLEQAQSEPAKIPPALKAWRPTCSILTSLYDGDAYLDGFLENCASWQGYDDMEHFVVRPASPGNEHERLIEHGRKHPSLVYLWLPEDPGLYEVWNLTARLSSAPYLTNANVDDRRAPDHVARLTACLDAMPDCDIVSSGLRNTDVRNLRWEESGGLDKWPAGSEDFSYGLAGLFRRRNGRLGSNNLPHCMPVWRSGLHVTNGYFDESRFGPSADWEFWLRCAQQGSRFRLISDPLGLHLKAEDSYWRRHSEAEVADDKVLARYTRGKDEILARPQARPLADGVADLASALRQGSAARVFWTFRELLLGRQNQTAGSSADALLAYVAEKKLSIADWQSFDAYLDEQSPTAVLGRLEVLFDFACHCQALAAIENEASAAVYLAFADEYDVLTTQHAGRILKARLYGRLGDVEQERFYLQRAFDADEKGFWRCVQRVYRFSQPLSWFLDNLAGSGHPLSLSDLGSIRRIFYYPSAKKNPYQRLLYRALGDHGVILEGVDSFSTLDLERYEPGDLLHIHWIRRLFESQAGADRRKAFDEFIGRVAALKTKGVQVLWTVHNRLTHDFPDTDFDKGCRRRLSKVVDRVVLHHPMQREMIADWISANASVAICEHGNYLDCYPNSVSQAEARRELGLDAGDTVVLIAGLIRPYKAIAEKQAALASWLRAGLKRKLVVAGIVSCEDTRSMLKALPSEQVLVVDRFLADEELQLYFNAASITLLSYRDVLTSGSLMESLSFGTPVLAPAMGSIPCYVVNGFNGWLYRDALQLADLLTMIGDRNQRLARMRENCLATARSAQWSM